MMLGSKGILTLPLSNIVRGIKVNRPMPIGVEDFGKTLALSMLKYYFEDAYDWNGNHIWNIGDIVGDVKMAFDVGSLTTRASVQMQGTLSTVNDCSFDLFYCYAGPYRYLIDPARGKILEKKSGKW